MYTAVIVEPRKHPALELVLSNFNRNLNNDWSFLIYHGTTNKEYIENIINTNNIKRTCHLVSLNKENLTIDDYNRLLFTEFFYNNINTDYFLMFQIDTLISDKFKDNIYSFLEYDYVGAPWPSINKVGNGGFSLRKKSKMIEMIKHGGYIKSNGEAHYEDRFFSNTCGTNIDVSLNIPSVEIAQKFSIEGLFSDNSFGLHRPWAHLNTKEIEFMKTFFPDLENLIKLHS